jgi:hypothetical protein
MDLYNLVISSIINILILLFIEGIIYFNVLTIIFEKIINKQIESAGIKINDLLNANITNIKKIFVNIDNDNNFISLALKLYTIGLFNKEITSEHDYILDNKVKSYAVFTTILISIFLLLIVVKIINYFYFNNNYIAKWIFIIINTLISVFIIGIFIIPIILVVFMNIQDNININQLSYQFVKIFYNLFNKELEIQ